MLGPGPFVVDHGLREPCADFLDVAVGAAEEGAPAQQPLEVEVCVVFPGLADATKDLDCGVGHCGQPAGECLQAQRGKVSLGSVCRVGGPQRMYDAAARQLRTHVATRRQPIPHRPSCRPTREASRRRQHQRHGVDRQPPRRRSGSRRARHAVPHGSPAPSAGMRNPRSLGDLIRLTVAIRGLYVGTDVWSIIVHAEKKDSLSSAEVNTDCPRRLSLLASALAGRTLEVAPVKPGDRAWTDGATVFVDADTSTGEQIQALAVQASLLAAGSLEPEVVRRLIRRPALARRYLTVEGHRALSVNGDLLPPVVRPLVDCAVAARSDSPAASLAAALSRQAIADAPRAFGAIRARNLLASKGRAEKPETTGEHNPHRSKVLSELDEEANNEAGDVVDIFSSPVGGGGALGRLLKKMLGAARRLGDRGGQPGADSATYRTRSGTPGAGTAVASTASSDTVDEAGEAGGIKYPEWDVYRRRYRPDWCTVRENEPPPKLGSSQRFSDEYGLRRALARLGVGLDRCHRQAQGDDIDIDAAVEARVEAIAESAPDEAVYLGSLRRRRDLSVLILLDVSGSVAEPGAAGQTVHEQQRAAAVALTVALHDLGDRVALYAFHSHGRSAVNLMPVKRFDDNLDALVLGRLHGLTPVAYSRLGAAIRHGAAVLEARGGTALRLLVVLSDGLAYDYGYERVYGAADARRALAEARRRGAGCLCLTIGAHTDTDELRHVFGSAAHATVPRIEQLSHVIGPLCRSALVSAEARRRLTQRKRLTVSSLRQGL